MASLCIVRAGILQVMKIKPYIQEIVAQALVAMDIGDAEANAIEVVFPRSNFGDFATNAAFVSAKKIGANPMAFAEGLAKEVASVDAQKVFEKVTAEKGFVNFSLTTEYLLSQLSADTESEVKNQKIIVEYFQNNVAKPPHVGHLRTGVVGDSLKRIFLHLGYEVVSDTHVGDWGTQFGILLYAYKTMGDKALVEKDPVVELNKLYVAMSVKIEDQPELRDLGKAEFAKLEAGDEENRKLWEWFVSVSMEDFGRYQQLLGLLPFEYNLGESFYEDKMQAILVELRSKGLVQTGETGEQYVDLEEYKLGRCILVKSDGATTYHLRDFATYLYRKNEIGFHKNIYVVDNRQSHHFTQLFKILELAGYPANLDSVHADVGFMSLPEGAISTRKGTVISLEKLFSEAEDRVRKIIEEKNPDLVDKEMVIRQVAAGAIKYFDLSHNRKTEIVFTWDKVLSFEGNTGPYVQYTYARVHSILQKAGGSGGAEGTVELVHEELQVLRKLIQFEIYVELAAAELLPHYIATFLYELAHMLNTFYEAVPVLKEADEVKKQFRLKLLTRVAKTLEIGLGLLGIESPGEM